MTITSNIFLPGLNGANSAAQSPGNAGGTTSLLDFINILAGNAGTAETSTILPGFPAKLSASPQTQAATTPGTSADTLLSLLHALTGGAEAQTTAAKANPENSVGAALKQLQSLLGEQTTTPEAQQKIESLLRQLQETQGDTPVTGQKALAPDTLGKIIALLQQDRVQHIQPSLTRDLTAQSATLVQQQSATPVTESLTAGLLSGIEPGTKETAEKQEATAATASAQNQMPLDIDASVLLPLDAKMNDRDTHFTRDDAIKFLEDKGFDGPTVQRYMNALDRLAAARMPKAAQNDVLPPQQAETPTAETRVNEQQQRSQLHVQQHGPHNAPSKTGGEQDATSAALPTEKTQAPQRLAAAETERPQPELPSATQKQPVSASSYGQTDALQPQSLGGVQAAAPGQSPVNTLSFSATAQPVTQTIAVQLKTNAMSKTDTMTIQLDPANLGRLDIRLKFDKDGGVRAHLVADTTETLAALKQDSAHLQRALQQAGFKTDDNTLSFDLRQQNHQQNAGGAQDHAQSQGKNSPYSRYSQDAAAIIAQIPVQSTGYISQSGVNIMV